MRRRLPPGVRMYTGDDFNYAELIAGDEQGYSDALLGIFDAIAPAASRGAGARLPRGDLRRFHGILEPTVPLSRHIFKAPTRFYKTGVVFLAWLNGQQDHFVMVGGQESARSLLHLAELFRLADAGAACCAIRTWRPSRMRSLLAHARVCAEWRPARPSRCRSTPRRCASSATCAQCIEACARHGITRRSRPGATRSPASA